MRKLLISCAFAVTSIVLTYADSQAAPISVDCGISVAKIYKNTKSISIVYPDIQVMSSSKHPEQIAAKLDYRFNYPTDFTDVAHNVCKLSVVGYSVILTNSSKLSDDQLMTMDTATTNNLNYQVKTRLYTIIKNTHITVQLDTTAVVDVFLKQM